MENALKVGEECEKTLKREVNEDVANAHKDAVRRCIEKINAEEPRDAGDSKEIIDVWQNFV